MALSMSCAEEPQSSEEVKSTQSIWKLDFLKVYFYMARQQNSIWEGRAGPSLEGFGVGGWLLASTL